jgi:hypothetical protein
MFPIIRRAEGEQSRLFSQGEPTRDAASKMAQEASQKDQKASFQIADKNDFWNVVEVWKNGTRLPPAG